MGTDLTDLLMDVVAGTE